MTVIKLGAATDHDPFGAEMWAMFTKDHSEYMVGTDEALRRLVMKDLRERFDRWWPAYRPVIAKRSLEVTGSGFAHVSIDEATAIADAAVQGYQGMLTDQATAGFLEALKLEFFEIAATRGVTLQVRDDD